MGASEVFGMILAVTVAIMLSSRVCADPDNLQDICVADITSAVRVNGFPCRSNATADDFFTAAIANSRPVNNLVGSQATPANVLNIPGLNTLEASLARIDFAPRGVNPPHTHPRATEVIYVLEGTLHVGFITTNNTLFSKTIGRGEVFTFPKGLVHFQQNVGLGTASVISAFNSQLPGTQSIAITLLAAKPDGVPNFVLARAFRALLLEVLAFKARFANE